MIVLASYPRSGNTFLRNILFEVYGIASKTYHLEAHGPDQGWEEASVVKTHLLPDQLPSSLAKRKVVYLVRDGRDAVVSLAHHKQALYEPSSRIEANITEATYAAEGSYFSGWSRHLEAWYAKADLVLHFEELIQNPLDCAEKLRELLDLPTADASKLPTFEKLKAGNPEYGSGKHLGKSLSDIWFRQGKVGSWKEEMTIDQQRLFWHLHGEAMEFIGYQQDGSRQKPSRPVFTEPTELLFEANKLLDVHTDGIKRYVEGILSTMKSFPVPNLNASIWLNGQVLTIEQALQLSPSERNLKGGWFGWAKWFAKLVLPNAWYHQLARSMPLIRIRSWLSAVEISSNPGVAQLWDVLWLPLPQHYFTVDELNAKTTAGTIHDLTHLNLGDMHESNNVERAELGMRWLKENRARLIAVSESTSNALRAKGLSSTVSLEGVDRRQFYPIINQHLLDLVGKRYALPNASFVLSVSTLEPRKNLSRLLKAFQKLRQSNSEDIHLVLAGRKGWKWQTGELPPELKNKVHFTGFVQEDHLPALYTLAKVFAYVSLEEGFGLPVLEALACGTPVVIADNSSLPEVAGDVGFECDPHDVDSIDEALQMMLDQIGEELSHRCMEQSWKFTWRAAFDRSVAAIAEERKVQRA